MGLGSRVWSWHKVPCNQRTPGPPFSSSAFVGIPAGHGESPKLLVAQQRSPLAYCEASWQEPCWTSTAGALAKLLGYCEDFRNAGQTVKSP